MGYMLVYETLPIHNRGIQKVCNKLFSINQVLEYHLFGNFKYQKIHQEKAKNSTKQLKQTL